MSPGDANHDAMHAELGPEGPLVPVSRMSARTAAASGCSRQPDQHTLEEVSEQTRASRLRLQSLAYAAEVQQLKCCVRQTDDAGRAEVTAQLKAALRIMSQAEEDRVVCAEILCKSGRLKVEQEETIDHLRQTIRMLDKERDMLVSEVDRKAEELQRIGEKLQLNEQTLRESGQKMRLALQDADRTALLLSQAEAERDALRKQLRDTVLSENIFREERAAREEELSATSTDLWKMIHENQMVNAEAQRFAMDNKKLHERLAQAESRSAYFKQAHEACKSDKDDILESYRRLTHDATTTSDLGQLRAHVQSPTLHSFH